MGIYFYGCISLDGYLAGKNHDLTWLFDSGSTEETSYEAFYKSLDITIMGRHTFDEVRKMTDFKEAYPTTTNYVFTNHDDLNTKDAIPVSGDVVTFVKTLDQDKNIWIVGGGNILTPLLKENMVDRLYLQFAPVLIGDGIPLFSKNEQLIRFTLTEVKKYGQFAELVYDKIV